MTRVSASILSIFFDAKKNKLNENVMIEKINSALKHKDKEFNILHLDIGDGVFIPNKTFRPTGLRKIRCDKKREAHFMVVNYKKYLKDYFMLADMFIFHNEVLKRDFNRTIEFLKKNKKFVGIAIKPETHIDEIKYLDKINLVLVMSVHPGFSGQKFIEQMMRKVRKLREYREKHGLKFVIEVDGGIDSNTSKKAINAGADILVMGTALFKK